MLNLDKLNSQLDLNNLDVGKIIKLITEHQNAFIKIVLVVGTLSLAIMMFNDHRVKDQGIRTKINALQQKLSVIKSRDQAVLDLNAFKSSVPEKITEYELISLISKDSRLCRVTITSLSPAESADMGSYDAINVNFNAVTDNFKDLMLFLRKIERSKYPLRVNSWSGREDQNGRITFSIEISAVLIHI